MSLQIIDVGSIANDNTGEPLRNAFVKVNENFSELFSQVIGTGANLVIVGNALEASNVNGDVELRPNGSGIIKLGNVLVNDYVISCSPIGTLVLDTTTNIKTLDVTNGFISASTSNLGSLSNVTITGGTAGYAIVTDGAGTLSWAAVPSVTGGSGAATRLAYFATTGANISDTGPNLTWNGANLFTVTGNISTGNLIAGNLTLGADKIVSANSIITIDPSGVGVTGTVIIEGNLQVTGTTTTVNSSTVEIADLNITLAKNAASAAAANGAGLTVAGANATINYASTGDKWTFNKHIDVTGAIIGSTTLSITGNANVGNLGTAGLITATGNVSGGNLTTTGVLGVTGNANVGNIGATNANITAITATGNANVGNLGTAGLIIATGNITGGNLNSVNLLSANNASITSNISAGNINNVSGILSVTGNANVGNLGAVHGAFTGNIRAGNINSVSGILSVTGNANLGNLGAGAGIFTGVVTVTGNITGGNISTGGVFNSTGNANVGNLGATAGVFTGNITAGNINSVTGILSVTGNANVGNIGAGAAVLAGPLSGVTTISASGNANVGNIGAGAAVLAGPLSGVTTISASGNANVGNIGATAGVFTNSVTITGNVSAGNISTTGILSVTGNANVGNIGAGAAVLAGPLSGATTINASGNANVGNLGAARGVFTTVVGNLETASQPNITVVGTLTGLTVSGNVIGQANLLVTSNITAGNINSVSGILSVTGNANVGNIGAGAAVLAGPLSGATTINASGNANVGNLGATAGVFTGNVNITGNTSAGNITATGILSVTGSANTGNLGVAGFIIATGNITGANVTSNGNVNTSNLSVTSLSNLGNVGNIRITGGSADYVLRTDGTGNLSWVAAGIISGSVSTGTGTRLAYYATNGQTISDTGSNLTWNGSNLLTVTGNISAGNLAGNVTTAAQPLITSLGSLTSLTVTGNASTGNISVTGNANVGTLVATNIVGSITTNAQPNITSVGNLIALNTGLTNITASTDSTSTTSGALVVAGGVGIGGNLHVGAANRAHVITGNVTITGNITVTGNQNIIGSNNISYTDNILELHNQANSAPWTTDDGKDVGIRVHYYKGSDKHAFFGWSNDEQVLEYIFDGSESGGVFSGSFGTIKGNIFYSTATTGTAPFIVKSTTQVANLNAAFAGTVTGNAQANITSVGTLTSLTVTGNANVGNIGATRGVFTNISGTLETAAQTNITSVGTLNSVTVSGNITGQSNLAITSNVTAGNINSVSGILTVTGNTTLGNVTTGNTITYGQFGTPIKLRILSDNSLSFDGSSGQLFSITDTLTGDIFSVNDITGLPSIRVDSNATVYLAEISGNVGIGNIVPAHKLSVTGTMNVSGNANVGNLGTAGLITATGNVSGGNLTTVGNLSVTGNANVGNIGATNANITAITATGNANVGNLGTVGNITASYFIGNGSLLSGVLIGTPSSIVNGNSNVVVFNNGNVATSVASTANVLVVTSTGANVAGTLTATGNITGGNIIAGNLILGSDALTSTHHTITIDPSTSGVGGNVIVQGNLQVTGTTTTVNSTAVEVSDLNITLAKDAATAAAANGAGLTVAGASATMTYASTGDKWTFNKPLDVTGSLTASTTLSVTGNANVGNIGASRGVFTNIVGTLETAAQTNITSVGTLSALTVSGNLTVDTNTLFVDSVNNKVGIGSITPAGLLGINGITFIGNQDSTGTTGTIRMLGTGGATYIQSGQNTTSGSAADLIFTSMNASTEWVRFKSDGTVGIGTASPAVKFEVSGNNIRLSGNATDVNFQLYNSASGAENWLIGNGQGSGAGTGLYFYNATDSQTRMLITNTGNVGIGNTAPTHALRVEGTFSASGSANVGNLGTAGLISATGNITGGNITTTGTVKGTKLVGGEFSTNGANLDLGIYASEFKVLEVFGSVNPNNSGSVDYTDIVHCYVYHGVGWNGSAVTSYIYVQHIAPPARSQYNSGAGLTHNLIDAVWLSSSNVESDSCSVNSATHQVRLKCTYSGTLSSFAVSVIKRM